MKFVSALIKNHFLYDNDDYLMVNQHKGRNTYIHLGKKLDNETLFGVFPIYMTQFSEKCIYVTDEEFCYMDEETREALDNITEEISPSRKYKITQYNLGYNI